MNPIGAALLACAAAGCAWAAWVSLRGHWRTVVIALSAALAVVVPLARLAGSPAATGRAAPPPSRPVGQHEPSSALTVGGAPGPLLAESVVDAAPRPVIAESAVDAAPRPVVAESAVQTPGANVPGELMVVSVAVEAVPLGADGDAQLGDEHATLASSEVQPGPERHPDALRPVGGGVVVPAAVDAPVTLRHQAAASSPAPSHPERKKTPPGQERPKKAKPRPHA